MFTDVPLGFRMSQSRIGTIPPRGGLGGAEPPPRCRPPSFLVKLSEVSEVSDSESCFDEPKNRAASSL